MFCGEYASTATSDAYDLLRLDKRKVRSTESRTETLIRLRVRDRHCRTIACGITRRAALNSTMDR
jgi:hypothetical protein